MAQSEYRIDEGIPLPPIVNPRNKYPFRIMKVGDSFFIPGKKRLSNFYVSAKRCGVKVSVRKVPGGLRCWRVQ